MRYLPISLDVRNKKCLVVGGGTIAERKIQTLLNFGARVVLISPEITPLLTSLVKRRKIEFIQDTYHKKYLEGVFLIIAATQKKSVNKFISQDARQRHILINCADDKENSSFISPAVLRRKNFTVAVSSDGRAPVLAKKIRDRIQNEFYLSWYKS